MREITQKIYNFNELDEKIQKKLIEKEIENNVDSYCELWLAGDMEYSAKEILKEVFGERAILRDVYYSLGCFQGDGAMIEFELKYYNKIVQVKHHGHYYHERSFVIEGDITKEQENKLKKIIIELNEKLTEEGYSYIEGAQNVDIALENLEGLEFYADGTQFEG